MQIAARTVVSFDFTLKNAAGEELDHSEPGDPLVYLHGASQIVPGLERELEGLSVGDEKDVVVAPVDAYGEREASGVFMVPRSAFPADAPLAPGVTLMGEDDDGNAIEVRVVSVSPESVEVDANHPLAGQTLHYHVAVRSVRQASPKEMMQGEPDVN